MRRTASALALAALLLAFMGDSRPVAASDCWIDPVDNKLYCHPKGTFPPGGPGETAPPWPDDPGLRYVHTATDPVIGPCHYWSDVPGGLDAWDPANDPAVIAVVTRLPLCPVPPVDPEARAWEVFRAWDLAAPEPAITPPGRGITGLPTYVSAGPPEVVTHDETLPDGRPLSVRARATSIAVDWGDGATSSAPPDEARPHPEGTVHHEYTLKTCSDDYRAEHPSGGLCHPTLDRYVITVSWVWTGEYDAGAGWTPLGVLVRSTQAPYDVDELRGVNVP